MKATVLKDSAVNGWSGKAIRRGTTVATGVIVSSIREVKWAVTAGIPNVC
ncbi:hypothetical protein NDN01_13890 [Sphingomonas sp. QA11]|nr:hypothetical protein [Sphingomonas sp. QA11]WCM25165.1 hypothetical protein NDN01_13890 [Sphingomonas sp. QA11]